MTENIMALIKGLRKAGLHEDLEFCNTSKAHFVMQAIEPKNKNSISTTFQNIICWSG